MRTQEQRCQTDEAGKMRCELIKRTWRQCPGKPSEEIASERSELPPDQLPQPFNFGGQSEWSFGAPFFGRRGHDSPGGGGAGRLPSLFGDGLDQMFAHFDSLFTQMPFGLPHEGPRPHERPRAQPKAPIRVEEI